VISEAHHRAIRDYVIAALNAGLADGMTPLDGAQVVWELQDFPRGADAWCSLSVVASVPVGEVERIEASVGTPPADVLEVTHRETWEVTVSVTLRSQRSDARPSWASDAGLRLRRVLTLRRSELADGLSDAGCPILRVGGIRDLSGANRGSQWESTAQVDLTLRVASQYTTRPGWAESVSGEARMAVPGGAPVVVPFDTET
jgi:hypothetical protein